MHSLKTILLVFFLIGCHKADRIRATWRVTELSQYPLTITNYGDAKLDKRSHLTFDDKGQLHIYLTDTTKIPEIFKYEIEDDQVIMWYSDYGIPLSIKVLNDNELELETSGFGNTKEERRVIKNLKFNKVQ